jgi:hypothetical protein
MIGITPTPGEPQFAMSYAATIVKTFTTQSLTGTAPFLTVGVIGGTSN